MSRITVFALATGVLLAACKRSTPPSDPAPAPSAPAVVSASPPGAASSVPTAPAASAPSPTATATTTPQEDEYSLGEPSLEPGRSYSVEQADSRQAAQEAGLRRVRTINVVPGKASVALYEGKDEEGNHRRQVDLISAGMAWSVEGYEGTDVRGPFDPGGGAPKLVFVTATQCAGGLCPAGCHGDPVEGAAQWRDGLWSEARALAGLQENDFADFDHDGTREFMTTAGNLDLTGCGGRWCCGTLRYFRVSSLVGWDGSQWTGDLARFRGYYEGERARNRSALEPTVDAGKTPSSCDRVTAAVQEALLARILQDDEPSIRTALSRATAGLAPADCLPDEPGYPWKEIVVDWNELVARLFSARLPRIPKATP